MYFTKPEIGIILRWMEAIDTPLDKEELTLRRRLLEDAIDHRRGWAIHGPGLRGNGNKVQGERNGRHKITAEEVRQIRAFGRSVPNRWLRKRFGIGKTQINRILNNESWPE